MTHFFDNALGGSAHGIAKGGLTPFGKSVLSEMERLGYLVDVAHNSHQLIRELIATVGNTTVLMSSHTGVQSVCDSFERNLNDEEIRG
jgi:membrane dipeptidase